MDMHIYAGQKNELGINHVYGNTEQGVPTTWALQIRLRGFGPKSRLGAISRPQIRRWDRRRCRMPDFWVTGRVSSFPNPCQCTLMNENRRIRIGF
jgi:hypothetical protein